MNIKQLNILLYISVTIMAIINLFCTNTLATQGVEINGYYLDSQVLEKQNQQLEASINQYSRLSYLQELAVSQGFTRIKKVDLVSSTSLVASNL